MKHEIILKAEPLRLESASLAKGAEAVIYLLQTMLLSLLLMPWPIWVLNISSPVLQELIIST